MKTKAQQAKKIIDDSDGLYLLELEEFVERFGSAFRDAYEAHRELEARTFAGDSLRAAHAACFDERNIELMKKFNDAIARIL